MNRTIHLALIIMILGMTNVMSPLLCQEPLYSISQVDIESKQNGSIINYTVNRPIPEKNITGWMSKTGWFYVTIFSAQSDSLVINQQNYTAPILDFQVVNSDKSTQFAFKLDRDIESFEFYSNDNIPSIQLVLRYPVGEVYSDLQQARSQIQQNSAKDTGTDGKRSYYLQIRNALYLMGSALTVAGVINADQSGSGKNWELPAGLGMVLGTYIYDQKIRPKLYHD